MDSTIVGSLKLTASSENMSLYTWTDNSRVIEMYQKYVIVHMDSTIVGSLNVIVHMDSTIVGSEICALYTWTVQ